MYHGLKKSNVGTLKVKCLSFYVHFTFQIAHSLLMFMLDQPQIVDITSQYHVFQNHNKFHLAMVIMAHDSDN